MVQSNGSTATHEHRHTYTHIPIKSYWVKIDKKEHSVTPAHTPHINIYSPNAFN